MNVQHGLGRRVDHDPRSWSYRVAGAGSARTSVRWERRIPVLDQGTLGSCTSNAAVGALGTAPNLVGPALKVTLDEAYAVDVYSAATLVDDAPGSYPPSDTGSTGLAVAKVLKARGLVSGYLHAFGVDDAFAAVARGPLLVGIPWYMGMYRPAADGVVTVSGQLAGGHEVECVGYDADRDRWEFVNSWGPEWGPLQGRFLMSTATFSRLLGEQGDVVLLVPADAAAPVPVPPADPLTAARAVLDPWAAARHVGATGKAAAAWRDYVAAVRP